MSMKSRPPAEPPRRRSRKLSDDEKTLWDGVAKHARPLRPRAKADPAAHREEGDEPSAPSLVKSGAAPKLARPVRPSAPAPAAKLPPLAEMPRRMKSRVARGSHDIDARIDLHGMRQDQAHRALRAFLANAAQKEHSLVLVITGKGKMSAPDRERGVLRAKVPQWLALPDLRELVIGFEPAHIGHGGEGALYVRVRKARKRRGPG